MHISSYICIVVLAHGITLHAAEISQKPNNNKRTAAQCSPAATHLSPSVVPNSKLAKVNNDGSPILGCHAYIVAESPQPSVFSSSDEEEESELREMVEQGNLEAVGKLIDARTHTKELTKTSPESLLYAALLIDDKQVRDSMIVLLRKAGVPECEHFKYQKSLLMPFELPAAAPKTTQ